MKPLGSSFIAAVTRKSWVFLNKKTSNCVRNPEKAGLYRFRNNGWKPQNCTGTVLVIIIIIIFLFRRFSVTPFGETVIGRKLKLGNSAWIVQPYNVSYFGDYS